MLLPQFAGVDYVYPSPYTVVYELVLILEIHCYNIPLIPNTVVEADKTIVLELDFLLPPGFNLPLVDTIAIATIVNDDSKCEL